MFLIPPYPRGFSYLLSSTPLVSLPLCIMNTRPLTHQASKGGGFGHVKAFKERLFFLYFEILSEFSAHSVGSMTIMNSMSHSPRLSLDLDMCPLLLVPLEEDIIAPFAGLLSSQYDSEFFHQIVEEELAPPWLFQD